MDPSADFYAAFVEALVDEPPAGISEESHRGGIASAAAFAREQIDALAPDLRWPLLAGLQAFQVLIYATHFSRFARLSLDSRRRILHAYAFGSWPLTRQLFRPIRATALVAYYETVVCQDRNV